MIKRPMDIGSEPFDMLAWPLRHREEMLIQSHLCRWCREHNHSTRDYWKFISRYSSIMLFLKFCDLEGLEVEKDHMFYLAGPYNNYIDNRGCVSDVENNIHKARQASITLWKMGVPIFSPHLNTGGFDIEEDVIMRGYLGYIPKMSGLILLPDHELSEGTKKEVETARNNRVPVYLYDDVVDHKWVLYTDH